MQGESLYLALYWGCLVRGARRVALLTAVLVLPFLPATAQAAEGPVFKDGEAQPVFDPKDVVKESLWVRAPVDSDRDGKDDLVVLQLDGMGVGAEEAVQLARLRRERVQAREVGLKALRVEEQADLSDVHEHRDRPGLTG